MPIVVIDPGHGGRDPGTEQNGLQEKTLVLQTCLLLRNALQRCGFQVIMTRVTDTLPLTDGTIADDLTYRANIANNAHADLFVAWHIDSIDNNPAVNGVAVWIYPNTRGTRTDTWAQQIVNGIASATGQYNRGVYLGDFAVLRETNMDAVLVEAGFLTNTTEARNLADPNFQVKQAEGAARGICNIFNMPYVAPSQPNPSQPTPTPPAPTPTPPPVKVEDIPSWAAEAIQKMKDLGVMSGYEDGLFHPNDTVTRVELASALARFYEVLHNNNAGSETGGV